MMQTPTKRRVPNNSASIGMVLAALLLFSALAGAAQPADGRAMAPSATLKAQAAELTAAATEAVVLGATRAGPRIVTVGDHGIVLLSDDDGATYRQAKSVPVRSTLTSVSFVDERQGWAVGHWGVIIHTVDGGETWTIQRFDTAVDVPLFSVWFKDENHGWAVGLWSLMMTTLDGGKTWSGIKLPPPPGGGKTDKNLFKIFPGRNDDLFVAAEQGFVLRSGDGGVDWTYLNTGYKGTFWTGTTLANGTVLVGGLRGTVYRSADDGRTWQASESSTKSSLTDIVALPDRVVASGLDGTILESHDGGVTFEATQRDDRMTLTAAVVSRTNQVVFFSKRGPVSGQNR